MNKSELSYQNKAIVSCLCSIYSDFALAYYSEATFTFCWSDADVSTRIAAIKADSNAGFSWMQRDVVGVSMVIER